MLIISVRDNENNRGNRNAKIKQKPEKKQRQERTMGGGAETIVKGGEINDFVVHLS